jgi:ATP-binding cassette, subfamily B (MDR/TAP), member 1
MVGGVILGLVFAWKIGLINIATAPLLFITGYVRLVSVN